MRSKLIKNTGYFPAWKDFVKFLNSLQPTYQPQSVSETMKVLNFSRNFVRCSDVFSGERSHKILEQNLNAILMM